MSEPMNNECFKGKGEPDFLDNLVTDKDVYDEANVKSNDFFHRIATNLLSEVLLEVINMTDGASLRSLASEVPIEASRIVASDLIIAHCLHLDAEEVAHNSDLGVTHISAAFREKPELAYRVFEIVDRVTPKVRQLHALNRIRKLKLYHLIKVLEAIHEVAVYGASEFLSKSEMILGVRFDKKRGIRKQRGAFYTPIEITEFICENTIGPFLDEKIDYLMRVLDYRTSVSSSIMSELQKIFEIRVIDPACGSGAFLTSALLAISSRRVRILEICESFRKAYSLCAGEKKQLDEWISILGSKNGFLRYFEGHMYGVDLDPAALEVASICLSLLSDRNPHSEGLKSLCGINLKEGNSLISELPARNIKLQSHELQTLLKMKQQAKACKRFVEKTDIIKQYENMVAQIQRRQIISGKVKRASQFFKDIEEKKAFCWELEFPEVFYSDEGELIHGFQFLVMNPPYDLLKPNRLEFMRLYNAREPLKMKEFEKLEETLEEEVRFYRKSGHYNLAIANVLNLYKLMLERALIVTSCTAILGFIVPSTLLCDESTGKLREEILNKYKIRAIFDFLESARVFHGVNQAVSIVIIDKSEHGEFIPLATGLTQLDDLRSMKFHPVSLDLVKKFSSSLRIPKTMEFGWKILEKIHSSARLSEVPWVVNLRGEVDLTIYKDCLSNADTGSVLVRGNDISRYVLRQSTRKKESFILKDKFLPKLGNSIKIKHINEKRIAGQQISNMMQRWRLKFCLVEAGTFLGNSCNYIFVSKKVVDRESYLLYMLAILNSCLLNWRFKLTSTNNHVNNVELDSLPLKTVDPSNHWENQLFKLIVDKVRIILQGGTTRVDPEIEAAIFSLYGLTEDEAEYILRSDGADDCEARDILRYFHSTNELCDISALGGI